MSRGIGARQRYIVARLKQAREPLRPAALAAGRSVSAMTSTHRALLALEGKPLKRMKVHRWPRDERCWVLVFGVKWVPQKVKKQPKPLPGQLNFLKALGG